MKIASTAVFWYDLIMNLSDLKAIQFGLDKARFGRVFSFVDFGNVNYWFERDERDGQGNILGAGKKLVVDVAKLSEFLKIFSNEIRFYFGLDPKNLRSFKIITKAREHFNKTVTKPIQRIKNYLDPEEMNQNTRSVNEDTQGKYVYIQKCNFDVEICVDAVRFLNSYDAFCLLSSDADFAYLAEFLRRNKKKFILISSGYVSHWLKDKADLNINSQQIKKYITFIKTKPRL